MTQSEADGHVMSLTKGTTSTGLRALPEVGSNVWSVGWTLAATPSTTVHCETAPHASPVMNGRPRFTVPAEFAVPVVGSNVSSWPRLGSEPPLDCVIQAAVHCVTDGHATRAAPGKDKPLDFEAPELGSNVPSCLAVAVHWEVEGHESDGSYGGRSFRAMGALTAPVAGSKVTA